MKYFYFNAADLARRRSEIGVFSYVTRTDAVREQLRATYGREGLCLKVFNRPLDCDIEKYKWGANPLMDCTRIQNLFAREGLSPRVYDVVIINGLRPAQVTDWVSNKPGDVDRHKVKAVKARYNLRAVWDMNPKNYRDGKMVDCQFWTFHDKPGYEAALVEKLYKRTAWGSRREPYHSVPELGVKGQRDNAKRWAKLGNDAVVGKTVLDVGCSAGMDAALALRYGAKRVTAVDLPGVVDVAWEAANYVGAWNVDFLGLKLPQQADRIKGPFDVVLAFSVQRQIGYSDWLVDLVGETLYLEGHVPDKERTYREKLEEDFRDVKFLGMTRDHGPRPLFRCRK